MHPAVRAAFDRVPERLKGPVELAARTVVDTVRDRVPGLAAEVAFFVLLSLPPLLLALVAGVGYLADVFGTGWEQEFLDDLVAAASTIFAPGTVQDVIEPIVGELARAPRPDLLGLGLLLTVYSASRAVRVVLTAITVAYDLEDTRPGWKTRVWGLVLTVAGLVLGLVLIPLLVAGPRLGEVIRSLAGLPELFAQTWRVLYWPTAAIVATALLAALYHVGTPWRTPWRRDVPGAVLAMVIWIAGSFGLRLYTSRAIGGADIYGPIAGPLILLLWLYVSAFAVLLGAELNAEIEKLWPTIDRAAVGPNRNRPPDIAAA